MVEKLYSSKGTAELLLLRMLTHQTLNCSDKICTLWDPGFIGGTAIAVYHVGISIYSHFEIMPHWPESVCSRLLLVMAMHFLYTNAFTSVTYRS